MMRIRDTGRFVRCGPVRNPAFFTTKIGCPAINAASSLVKNRTAPVASSGSPSPPDRLILQVPRCALLIVSRLPCICQAR